VVPVPEAPAETERRKKGRRARVLVGSCIVSKVYLSKLVLE
jgi:hypothetical protein